MNSSLSVDIYPTSPFLFLLLLFPVLSGCAVQSCVHTSICMCLGARARVYVGVLTPVWRPDIDVSNRPPSFFDIIH